MGQRARRNPGRGVPKEDLQHTGTQVSVTILVVIRIS